MDPIKKSYTRFRYSQETLEKALNAIIRGETSINKASKTYNIPKSTLHNKINNKVPWQRKMGPVSQLTFEEERKLARWILNKAKVGFPMHPEEVYDTVKNFLDTNQRNTKFTNNRPVDYSKCINTRRQQIAKDMDASITDDQKDDLRSTMKVIEYEVGHTIKNEFMQSYITNRAHVHHLYALWSKCKAKLENRRQPMKPPPATDTPLDLSNASAENQETNSFVDQEPHLSSPNPSSPVVLTITESAQIHVCTEENEVNPSVRNSVRSSRRMLQVCSILLDDNILFDTSNKSRLETTDDIVNFIIQNETNNYNYEKLRSPIPLPWYDTLPHHQLQLPITTNDTNSSITVQSHHDREYFFSKNSHIIVNFETELSD
ncbi:unnamed protein product [Colias eurytheme]|nr:unnamed protein product [Colias eurytheme]